ncbi:nucleoside 2-deoxyribosyltransferase [Aerococcaceae bacterium INB8]|uniref:Putative 2'-deoxynucleoside 5'-phosphate N-hydrolase 1 n=1 Tax=Ruoffia halotolerans TaxID=2748684 RepID=A0A839A7R6_9LACT|nr:nucleoside 2-deoxyribosyltransferase [Ruoffia halotolerans]MBA5729585.1 nucleoside 2-deoxyribosyltransferase [Ruoffia halotolerans]
MKVYFAASIRGGRADISIYKQLIAYLSNNHEVLTEHIGDDSIIASGEVERTDKAIRDRDIQWIEEWDVMVAETTNPSLGVGYELAYAEHIGKPVIIIHRTNQSQLSAMIAGTDYFDSIYYYEEIKDAIGILEAQLGKEE